MEIRKFSKNRIYYSSYALWCVTAFAFLFARHGRALTGESPEHAWATRKCIAEQQGCPS